MLDVNFHWPEIEPRRKQLELLELNRFRLTPTMPCEHWREGVLRDLELTLVEGEYIEDLRKAVAEDAAAAPTAPHDFIGWFAELERTGPGQHDELFPWLAEQATLEQMTWFLTQEVAGEAGFEDLTATTQVRLPSRPKLEMARNYWGEMGRGNEKAMHGPLLEVLSDALNLRSDPTDTVLESLMLGNLMAGLALNRRYAYQSVGALGAIELTAPARASHVNVGLKRLGYSAAIRHYFSLHAVLDVRHSQTWNAEVIFPLVERDARFARAIAEGALMRLQRGSACFECYRSVLW